MINIITNEYRTNSYLCEPWRLTETPFKAYRASSHTYTAFLAVANDYNFAPKERKYNPDTDKMENCGEPIFNKYKNTYNFPKNIMDSAPSKLITTKKGTRLLVPCSQEEDEKIALVTLQGAFRGSYQIGPFYGWWENWRKEHKPEEAGIFVADGVEVVDIKEGNKHCVATVHAILRFTSEAGSLPIVGHGRREGDFVDLVKWNSKVSTIDKEEFKIMKELKV